jgi:hypothetical protein
MSMPDPTAPCTECRNGARQIPTETMRNMVEPFGNNVREAITETQEELAN